MLPFSPPPGSSFHTGQRLRPASARPGSLGGISHSKRTHVISYGAHNGKPHAQPFCTRNRCIAFLLLLATAVLYLTRIHSVAEPPLNGLKRDIDTAKGTNTDVVTPPTPVGLGVIGEELLPATPSPLQPNDAVLVERAQKQAVSAKLAQAQTELAAAQLAFQKVNQELESAKAKIEQQQAAAAAAAASPAVTPSSSSSSSSVDVAGGSRALSTVHGPIEVPGYPPIAIAASKKYSKFYCIGGRGRLDSQNDRSCRFQNVCYQPSKNQWQFYQDPAEKLVVLLDKGVIIEEFPAQFLNLRSMGNPQDAQWWSPSIVKSSSGIPPAAFAPRTHHARPEVHVLYHPHYPSNMGHVIGDDLFPIFNLMSSFGMLLPSAQLIISRDCNKIFHDNPKKAEQCDFFMKMLTPGLSNKPYLAATSADFVSQVRGGASGGAEGEGEKDLVCFEQLLAGNGPWGFQQSLGKAPSWWSYHAFYLGNLGVNPNRTPKKQRITVSIKKGKRALANNDELVAYLQQTFPTYEVHALELKSLGGWKQELEYLLDTSVLITPCGGVSMSAMFLPHNAALVIVDYFNLRKNVSFGMEERLWSNLGYVRPFHYPFTIDEVELPPDHKRDDYQDMRDWGQVRVNLDRMGTIVKAAISHTDNFMVFGQQ